MFRFLSLCGLAFILATATYSCKSYYPSNRQSADLDPYLLQLRDSILQQGLDGEALYTILGNIKPMSSVAAFSFPVGNKDSLRMLDQHIVSPDSLHHLQRLAQIQQAVNLMQFDDLRFLLVPYRNAYSKTRILQLTVIRVSKLDSLLEARADFFGQYGFTKGTDPAVVLTVNEYEKRYERLRGYGYLFGYPNYAIDFFVKAFHESDSTGVHVKRKFFQIPTYLRNEGNFVYAYPEDHQPDQLDSALYQQASAVLAQYKALRPKYMKQDSTISAHQLIQHTLQRRK
ncbi:hypothetical protein [Sphingobacterium corticibacter]|uniref:Lipoprotein n=1 Tax=Sphingobacterium corticibacter TaxID=2171749 RepID=A0A2T8HP37_9SPHI|nr:hypothetical protein [Sphingobacterium corticibacter]PVH27072.1 hypothetical protein DC487_05600 [Sphingobacterium corticibacter]